MGGVALAELEIRLSRVEDKPTVLVALGIWGRGCYCRYELMVRVLGLVHGYFEWALGEV